ncbi:hypothetical protein [Mesorhizobium sp. M7A.F.Ca.MR.245.00.0.0]|uniref:hypothetical protein n=1 Tax=Mesorhizobium sp. M7A.F.Ca.MR.245.00.0.0 TaxID=2496778 RepID=UPI000FCB556B|nr:hypothetical protein [Mesorhizobium sp. M7A.F.Ca.MR.245.00.0.0]RUV21769.1 hypothetical protein EOB80_09775 [Mesorhizobium sp. M7A.F.Ca.MR.245.00.0.0]
MAKATITWPDLLEVYLNSVWDAGDNGHITVANQSILETLGLIEISEKAAEAADITPLIAPDQVKLDSVIPARIGYPKYSLGLLVETWDGLLRAPERRVEESSTFFIKSDRSHSGLVPASDALARYRAILKFVATLSGAALFTDVQHAKLVYFGDGRVEVPVRYDASDFRLVEAKQIEALAATLEGDIHREQRLSILGEAVTTLVASQPAAGRFVYLLQNADELKKRVDEGYKLFASSFSYSKIRSEIEKNQADYVNRVHKTFTDIQGQLLGLPVSAVVVATQMKATNTCGPVAIANIAILGGACLFVALLIASCANQWLTLGAIDREIKGQRTKLNSDFSEIRDMFTDAFDAIEGRIRWHRVVLIVISLVALAGAWFTWQGYSIATKLDGWGCLVHAGIPTV